MTALSLSRLWCIRYAREEPFLRRLASVQCAFKRGASLILSSVTPPQAIVDDTDDAADHLAIIDAWHPERGRKERQDVMWKFRQVGIMAPCPDTFHIFFLGRKWVHGNTKTL